MSVQTTNFSRIELALIKQYSPDGSFTDNAESKAAWTEYKALLKAANAYNNFWRVAGGGDREDGVRYIILTKSGDLHIARWIEEEQGWAAENLRGGVNPYDPVNLVAHYAEIPPLPDNE